MIPNQEYVLNSGAPTQIYPYALQQALTLKNTGTVDVFVSPSPTLSNGLKISAGRSVAWEAGNALYGYTESGTGRLFVVAAGVTGQDAMEVTGSVAIDGGVTVSGDVTVSGPVDVSGSTVTVGSISNTVTITGAVTSTVSGTVDIGTVTGTVTVAGDVNATITSGSVSITSGSINAVIDSGEVNIGGVLTPVLVQSAGEDLAGGTFGSITRGSYATVSIPEPTSAMRYQALRIVISIPNTSTLKFYWNLVDANSTFIADGTVISAYTTYDYLNANIFRENVTVPGVGNYPYTLSVYNLNSPSGSDTGPSYLVTGLTAPVVTAATNLKSQFGAVQKDITAGTGFDILLPPSHTPYRVRIVYPGYKAIDVTAYLFLWPDSTFISQTTQVMREAKQEGGVIYEYIYPGGGVMGRLVTSDTFDVDIIMSMEPF